MQPKGKSEREATYVPFPILDQLFSQKAIGSTPFASACVPNARYEPSVLVNSRDPPATECGTFRVHMTYPASLQAPEYSNEKRFPSRSETNFFEPAQEATPSDARATDPAAANYFWQIPPATLEPGTDRRVETRRLPRDTFHPLLSALQAGENAKAAGFNPLVGLVAGASRKGPPCQSHVVLPKSAQQVAKEMGEPDAQGYEPEESMEGGGTSMMKQKMLRMSQRKVPKTAVGRAYSSDGGFHDPDQYSSKIMEFASSQPTTLTAIAAKALGSAIHTRDSHSIPVNVLKSRRAKPLPNSTKNGFNVNRFECTGLNDESNVVLPPAPAFRRLSSEVKEALLNRTRDTRHRVEDVIRSKYVPIEPPPLPLTDDVKELVEGQVLRGPVERSTGKRFGQNESDDEDELDRASETEVDPLAALGQSSALSIWSMALRRKASRLQNSETFIPKEHPAREVLVSRKFRIFTPHFFSVYSNGSMNFSEFMGGSGVRMEDVLTQTKPPSQSSFQEDGLKRQEAIKQFSNIRYTPSNTFGFDNNRMRMLLAEKGSDIESFFLEGATQFSEEALMNIGTYCPSVKLMNLAECTQVTDSLLQYIFQKSQSLAYLNVSGCTDLTGAPFVTLFESCPALNVLCASGLPLLNKNATIAFTRLYMVRQLSVIDLSFCDNLSDEVLICVAEHCRNLEMLDISGCRSVGDTGVASIGSSCSKLVSWKLRLLSQLTGASLSKLSIAPRNLRVLDLSGCKSLDGKMFAEVVKHLPSLRRLSISGCSALNDSAISKITKYCSKLKSLNMSNCVDISLSSCMELIHELTGLRRLVVSESTISNAEVDILSGVRESCKIIRNQFRPLPQPRVVAFKPPEPKKKAATKDPKKGKK